MINPKYKNVFMAPDGLSAGNETNETNETNTTEPLVVNGHTINSKLGGLGRTIAETLRHHQFKPTGQTIGSALGPMSDANSDANLKPWSPPNAGVK